MVDKVAEISKNPIVLLIILILCGGGGGYGIGTFTAKGSIEDVKRDNAILQERLINTCDRMADGLKKIEVMSESINALKIDSQVLKREIEEIKRMLKISVFPDKIARPVCKIEVKDECVLQMLCDN